MLGMVIVIMHRDDYHALEWLSCLGMVTCHAWGWLPIMLGDCYTVMLRDGGISYYAGDSFHAWGWLSVIMLGDDYSYHT